MPVTTQTVSIEAGQSLSSVIDATMASPARIFMPAAWNGTYLTFQVSSDGVNFFDLYDRKGAPVAMVIKPGTVVAMAEDLGGKTGDYLKIRAGSSEQPRPQDAKRDFIITLIS